jgi:hypothetical protein
MQQGKCPRCQKAGLVRAERVITADTSLTAFCCGGCELRWEETDFPQSAPPAPSSRRRARERFGELNSTRRLCPPAR